MEVIEREGILPMSYLGITIPTTFAKETLYYIPYYGRFYCDDEYYVDDQMMLNQKFGSYVFFYLVSGSLWLETRGKITRAEAGSVIFINCEYAHKYYCRELVDFYWFHVDGNNIGKYYDYIYEKYGSSVIRITAFMDIKSCIQDIFNIIDQSVVNEHFLSLQIANILAQLAVGSKEPQVTTVFDDTISYIRKNFREEVTLDDLAKVSGFSKSYFINEFKKIVGSTPHDYLLAYRLQEAKKLLRTSTDSMEVIADKCGFNSASHFSRAFKKENRMTPLQFRNAKF